MEHWQRKFIFLGIGQAVSILTSSILQMSIVWYLTQRTQSPAVITLATLSGYLPRAVLGLFTGTYIDRYDRKKIVILSDFGIAMAALFLAAVAALRTDIPIGLIYFVLCIRSIGTAFHTPSLNAVIPTIVPKEQLARCAGFMQSFDSISLILSPALAAVLFNIWSLSAIILLDVAGAAIAITIVLLLQIPKTSKVQNSQKINVWQDTKKNTDYTVGHIHGSRPKTLNLKHLLTDQLH